MDPNKLKSLYETNSYAKCGDLLASKNRKYQISLSYYPFLLHTLNGNRNNPILKSADFVGDGNLN
jgi:hypothetical protein